MAEFHRTNLHLYTHDVVFLIRHFGYGWTGHVRELVRREVERLREARITKLDDTVSSYKGMPIVTRTIIENGAWADGLEPVDLRGFDLDRLIQEQDQ